MQPAARITDLHTCLVGGGGPILPIGCPTVRIGFLPAARMGDALTCAAGPDTILLGSPTVRIGGQPAARMGDPTGHGGVISMGCPTVRIGMLPQAAALLSAAEGGVPFCEDCAKASGAPGEGEGP
jgi:uncharacterized Zn-binding protein involved in type VI secretion